MPLLSTLFNGSLHVRAVIDVIACNIFTADHLFIFDVHVFVWGFGHHGGYGHCCLLFDVSQTNPSPSNSWRLVRLNNIVYFRMAHVLSFEKSRCLANDDGDVWLLVNRAHADTKEHLMRRKCVNGGVKHQNVFFGNVNAFDRIGVQPKDAKMESQNMPCPNSHTHTPTHTNTLTRKSFSKCKTFNTSHR